MAAGRAGMGGQARRGTSIVRSARRRTGFTVVELMAALAITAAALSLTYQTFRLALNAQERGMARLELLQRIDSAMEMMARDLRSAINLGSEGDYLFESSDYVEGEATADTLGFVSTVNNPQTQLAHSYDLARIEYVVDFDPDTPETGLVRRQLNFPIPEDEDQRDAAARTMEVLPTAQSLSILLYDNASAEWVENWDEMEGMPGAVKLELVVAMIPEQTEDEEEEEEQSAEPVETKTLTLLVYPPASRYTPSEDGALGEAASETGGGEEGPGEEAAGAGGPEGSGGSGIPELPEAPGLPTGGFGGGGR